MNVQTRHLLLAGFASALLLAAAGAWSQAAPKPENLIKWRQSAFQFVAWNASRIKASVEGTYNKDDVIKSANAIAAVANSGFGTLLFVPGTETGKGWHDTAAKPALFSDSKRAGELAASFGHEAEELAKLAQAGDAGAVKEQYARLTRTCKACHDDFRAKD
jgi:cytochrome c556